MANILSQNEIDDLLGALASGEDSLLDEDATTDLQEVKPYDFRTANKFSKDQMRTLQFIYDNYATRLSTYLSGTLRAICEVEVISIEEQSFSEFSNSMPAPVILSIINMTPLRGAVLMEIMPSIAYEIISRLLGGDGQYHDTEKSFTEIELGIIERILRKMLFIMNEAWEKICKVNVSLDRVATSPQYAQIVSGHEPIAIITMNIKIGEVSDIINLCIPHVAIQPISEQLIMKTWYSEQGTNALKSTERNLGSSLSNIYLNMNAVFNDTQASVKEILNVQVGDVIRIDHNINRQVVLKVEHIPKFKGFIGMQGTNYAVQISDILEEE